MSYRAAAPAALADDDIEEESLEHTLLVVREVSVFKIPPRSSSGGYKCGEWLQSDKIWSGRLRVVSIRDLCEIRLEDSNTGALFAACHVHPGKRDLCVESAMDSSRYFVLRIDDGQGKHAFIGLGFAERNEAFDFNVALSDHEKHVLHHRNREDDDEVRNKATQSSGPSLDLRLKEGETIKINVKPKTTTSNSRMISNASNSGDVIASTGRMKAPLAPPPGGGRIRSPLPPPPNDTRSLHSTRPIPSNGSGLDNRQKALEESSSRSINDAFSDLSKLGLSLPSGTATSNNAHVGGWAAF